MKRLGLIVTLVGLAAFAFVSIRPTPRPGLSLAVASSFAPFLESLKPGIEKNCGARVHISAGSSGTLAAQLLNNGPFDAFFSADAARPKKVLAQGIGVGMQTYAYGRLAFWQPSLAHDGAANTRPLALADPALAPYGRAARQSLARLRTVYTVPQKEVVGRSAAQAFQFVYTGAAGAGLVPLSLLRYAQVDPNEYRLVPDAWYAPVRQDVLVVHQSAALDCLLALLQSPSGRAALNDAGFIAP